MTPVNIIDTRPNAPLTQYAIEQLISQPDPREVRLSELEAKLAEIETHLKDLQKIATAVDKIYELEARLKSLQALVVEVYNAVNHMTQTPYPPPPAAEAKVVDNGVNPQPALATAEKEVDQPALTDIERMVLRVLYKKVEYWHGRANLKVDENGYAVIGRDVNFGVKFSQFVAIMTKFGLADLVFARGNDRAGYYVEIKASEMGAVLRHLKTLDEQLKGALSRL